ncbi:hypothetical protein [Halostagnicola kamekurae]|uniref:Uncharacterized protein n=1 Tax=Halostagnicola kamekurae TaxID=619731 RepID=A0A1I6UTV4_9EURY|nr:hypothetical protein [Halostagnicola kamekurae]SFT04836.1 hypothetical protein SAMN04488556_4094 [Halostagnicola kamekurae]
MHRTRHYDAALTAYTPVGFLTAIGTGLMITGGAVAIVARNLIFCVIWLERNVSGC